MPLNVVAINFFIGATNNRSHSTALDARKQVGSLTTKAQIIAALKTSFAYAHAQIATITPANAFLGIEGANGMHTRDGCRLRRRTRLRPLRPDGGVHAHERRHPGRQQVKDANRKHSGCPVHAALRERDSEESHTWGLDMICPSLFRRCDACEKRCNLFVIFDPNYIES